MIVWVSADGIAPESIVAAYGTGLATQTLLATQQPLPTSLAGTTVVVKDSPGIERLAPLFFVSPQQINCLIPSGTAPGTASLTVTSGDGKLSIGALQISTVAPSLFTANFNGQGVATGVALRVKANGDQVYEPIVQFDQGQNRFVALPIDLGPESEQVYLILYGMGIRYRSMLSAVMVSIGGLNHPVLYAGIAPGYTGLDQVNVGPLARSLMGRGEVDIVMTVDGKRANLVKVSFK